MGETDRPFKESDVEDDYWRDGEGIEWGQLIESSPLPACHLMELSGSTGAKMVEPDVRSSGPVVGSSCSEEQQDHSDTKQSDQTEYV